ncbi:hypothetical protein HG531_003787 [Fusarium graminearum]|nr:hypothetical protein HG531_003787 [Fusarium graminearum]
MRSLSRPQRHLSRSSCHWILSNPDILSSLSLASSLEAIRRRDSSIYGLVVAEALCYFACDGIGAAAAETEIIHGSLGGGCGVEGAENKISDLLGCFGCAAYGSCCGRGREDGVVGTDDLDGFEAALVERDVGADH